MGALLTHVPNAGCRARTTSSSAIRSPSSGLDSDLGLAQAPPGPSVCMRNRGPSCLQRVAPQSHTRDGTDPRRHSPTPGHATAPPSRHRVRGAAGWGRHDCSPRRRRSPRKPLPCASCAALPASAPPSRPTRRVRRAVVHSLPPLARSFPRAPASGQPSTRRRAPPPLDVRRRCGTHAVARTRRREPLVGPRRPAACALVGRPPRPAPRDSLPTWWVRPAAPAGLVRPPRRPTSASAAAASGRAATSGSELAW